MKSQAAIVFGGASGLGEATARALADAGHTVTVADLNEEKGLAVANEIGGTFVNADVTDEESVKEAVASAAASADDGLRVCVNCAGVGAAGRIVGKDGAAPFDGYKWAININLLGTINVLRLAAESMVGNEPDEHLQRGVCINTASIAASGVDTAQKAVLVLWYTGLATLLVWAPIICFEIFGQRAIAVLRAGQGWMAEHQQQIVFYALIVLGLVLIFDGLVTLH